MTYKTLKWIGVALGILGFGLNFVSDAVNEKMTEKQIEEEVTKQLHGESGRTAK